jgi:hypothetical protein
MRYPTFFCGLVIGFDRNGVWGSDEPDGLPTLREISRINAKNTGVFARTSGKVIEFARNAMHVPTAQLAMAA